MSVRILTGHVRDRLAELPDESVHCIVTSPPYYGLRDYGVPGQIGLEATLDGYITALVDVFQECRRVLRSDGTCWINIGDSYAGSWGAQSREHAGKHGPNVSALSVNQVKAAVIRSSGTGSVGRAKGLKPKSLMMVPARLALALQADGWYLRSDIIWAKPNPMPESARDRPTNAHEHIFLLTKSARYWYDADSVRTEPKAPTAKMPDGWETGPGTHGSFHRDGRTKGAATDKQRGHSRRHAGFNDRWDAMSREEQQATGANLRNVWTIATVGFPEAHFATFPPEIPRRCIKAGCPEGGVVLDPFFGSGTTGLVADELGRDCIGIELNPEYAQMAQRRIRSAAPLLAEVTT